jgi:hypothetical protein
LSNAKAHVGVEVGHGLVARFNEVLVLVLDPGQHRAQAEALLNAVESATDDAAYPGALIAARLAGIVAASNRDAASNATDAGNSDEVPPFGAVAPLETGYVVLLHGPVSAEITGPHGVVLLSGEQAVTWVDYKLEVPVDRLSVTSGNHPVRVDPMSDLRAGLVPGSGFVMTPHEPANQSPDQTDDGAANEMRATAGSASTPVDVAPTTEVAEGPPPHGSDRSTEALTAPIGHLVATDGMRIPLDRAYVLGREPDGDPAVASGEATPVRLTDDDSLISRVQSYIAVEAGQVSLRDAASANGTFVAAPGDESWSRVGDDVFVLPPEWSMRVGNRVFTYVAAPAPV